MSRKSFEILSRLLGSAYEISPAHVIVGRSSIHDILKKSVVKALGNHVIFQDDLSWIVDVRYKCKEAVVWFELPKLNYVQFCQTVVPAMFSKAWIPGIVVFTSDLNVAFDIAADFPMVKMSKSRLDQDEQDKQATEIILRELDKRPEVALKLLLNDD